MLKRFALLFVAAALLGAFGCSELDPVSPGENAIKADDGFGNCLSVPVIWAEDVSLSLRGTFGAPEFNGAFTTVMDADGNPVDAYHQKDQYNVWQASTIVPTAPVNVDFIDWGDNLESKAWPANSKLRVEVVLFEGLTEPATEFEMAWVSGLGIDELWGATTVELAATQATVYSNNARLTIQKLDENPQDLTWNATLGQWEGDISEPFYNSAVFDSGDSPITKYSAEINVKGKVIYGMLWDVATTGDGMGTYRITFSFDDINAPQDLNTFFDEFTQIMIPEPEEEVTAYSPDKAEPTGGITYIDTVNNLTYIDQPITRAKGGGGGGKPDKPGGGHGGGGGGGHGGGR